MKNIFQLIKFAKTPSSAQIIFEEKKYSNIGSRNVFKAEESDGEEKDPLKLRIQQKKLLKLSKTGLQTQIAVNNLGKSIGAKINSDRLLDEKQLKKLNAKKCEAMFPVNAVKTKTKSSFKVVVDDI